MSVDMNRVKWGLEQCCKLPIDDLISAINHKSVAVDHHSGACTVIFLAILCLKG